MTIWPEKTQLRRMAGQDVKCGKLYLSRPMSGKRRCAIVQVAATNAVDIFNCRGIEHANTYVLAPILIILLAILAVTQKDGKTFRRSALPFRTFDSNSQLNLTCIEDLLLRRATSPEAHISESKGPTAEAGQSSTANVCKESDFPENWWTGDEVFRLERRAIFSKTWLYIAHISRFAKPGDYHAFEICGFPLFLIQGKDGIIRAFHNVCRHRAYPVISMKKSGSSTVIGCRYHGWSYNTSGRLIKAPQFECLEGFDKTQNSLFEIHSAVTKNGLIFVNLDARGDLPELGLGGHGIGRFTNQISRKSVWIDGWEIGGKFNWKMAVRNLYVDKNTAARVKRKSSSSSSILQSIFGVTRTGKPRSFSLDAFRTTLTHLSEEGSIWYSVSITPICASRSNIRCDVYGNLARKQVESQEISNRIKSILESRIGEFETAYEALGSPGSVKEDIDSGYSRDLKLTKKDY
ncbi:Rieske domain-containing protein [Histoplasma capsulatum G186AR]|uniref:Rieske domain-containing protein n=1 Tax=Ajellomyces capsulatus (strain G186AR / H82 / ATCC MYA-2454 / RMSCC 2432) TaxID=447093 RepID=C0NHL5_AJECG|nr:Rieske domain-containing protein [Histoplasma capsulatum G186AR]EEH09300.1 Rieske domain-containing protein [Histoplasma capsulatum G186AR]